MIYDFTPAYLKPPLQIRVPHLHKAMSPNVTGDMVRMVRFAKKQAYTVQQQQMLFLSKNVY